MVRLVKSSFTEIPSRIAWYCLVLLGIAWY